VDGFAFQRRPTSSRASPGLDRMFFGKLFEFAQMAEIGSQPVVVSVALKNKALVRLAQPDGRLD
jgi:hypothetical protein